jgi:hypothetical protein
MPATPDATHISVREVLAKFDSDFAAVARAVENGEFAFWIGSGISRNAANLGDLIDRAIEFLRSRSVEPATQAQYMPALQVALRLARVKAEDARLLLAEPFDAWPNREAIRNEIWNSYSRLLDIRIKDEPADYMLWDAVDVCAAFARPPPPASQHLCIAILMLEGAVRDALTRVLDPEIRRPITELDMVGDVVVTAGGAATDDGARAARGGQGRRDERRGAPEAPARLRPGPQDGR